MTKSTIKSPLALAALAVSLTLTMGAAAEAGPRFGTGHVYGTGYGAGHANVDSGWSGFSSNWRTSGNERARGRHGDAAPDDDYTAVPENEAPEGDIRGRMSGSFRVVNLGRHDRLNVRIGPGVQYPVVDALYPRERGISLNVCVPTRRLGWRNGLSFEMRRAISSLPTWCLVEQEGRMLGWVNARYLARR